MIPSVFLGLPWVHPQPASPVFPSVTIGTSDFSIECWVRKRFGNSPGADEQYWTGLLVNDAPSGFPDIGAVIRWGGSLESGAIQLIFARVPGGAEITLVSTALLSELQNWTHICANFDRDLNMTLFRNNVNEGSTSIAAQAAAQGATEVHALTADHSFPFHNTDITTWSGISIFPVMVGPFAIHNRLLTAAERQESIENRRVQNLGSSVTLVYYTWHAIEGATGWDTNLAHMMNGHRVALQVPGGAPLGASGTVFVRDGSGNDRHWILPTSTDYSTFQDPLFVAEVGVYKFAFGGDVAFR
jgi:hypothetical protein